MNEAVCRYSNENCIRSMGTTMALLSFSEKAIYACNLGDSRIYRHFQGKLQQISTDHVIGGKMLGKAPLTQYLGFQEENMALEPSIVGDRLSAGELVSDLFRWSDRHAF